MPNLKQELTALEDQHRNLRLQLKKLKALKPKSPTMKEETKKNINGIELLLKATNILLKAKDKEFRDALALDAANDAAYFDSLED